MDRGYFKYKITQQYLAEREKKKLKSLMMVNSHEVTRMRKITSNHLLLRPISRPFRNRKFGFFIWRIQR